MSVLNDKLDVLRAQEALEALKEEDTKQEVGSSIQVNSPRELLDRLLRVGKSATKVHLGSPSNPHWFILAMEVFFKSSQTFMESKKGAGTVEPHGGNADGSAQVLDDSVLAEVWVAIFVVDFPRWSTIEEDVGRTVDTSWKKHLPHTVCISMTFYLLD